MKLIYLAHPYGGNLHNTFKSAALHRALKGHIFNPVSYYWKFADIYSEVEIMRMCLDMLGRCDELWVSPGWESSPGCNVEIAHATKLGMKIRYLELGNEL